MSATEDSLSHARWECKYHVVFIPKYRKKAIMYDLRKVLGEQFREFTSRKEKRILRGHVMMDHVQC